MQYRGGGWPTRANNGTVNDEAWPRPSFAEIEAQSQGEGHPRAHSFWVGTMVTARPGDGVTAGSPTIVYIAQRNRKFRKGAAVVPFQKYGRVFLVRPETDQLGFELQQCEMFFSIIRKFKVKN